MRCFTCCFRIRDDHRQPITAISKTREPVDHLASDCVWSVLASEVDDRDLSHCEDERCGVTGYLVLDDELRAEAKFLKACGTLPQTPVEIRKIEKPKDAQPHNDDPEPAFHSWIPNTAIEKIFEKQPDHLQSPIKLFEKWENDIDFSTHPSTSLKNIDGVSSSSSEVCGIDLAASTQCKNKSVHFESQHDSCSFSSKDLSPKIIKEPLKPPESPFNHIILKPSPNPTPLKLTDDMQTPGTVFPSYGKNPRIRFQYVHLGMNTHNFSQLDAPIEEEYLEQADKESPQSQVKLQASATEMGLNVGPTLSPWLPPKSNYEVCTDQSLVPISHGQIPGDRPILGVVTAYWNADEIPFTPKWGDGNGVPNTTNKYSEDQKVSWHATPFEERLEKALMEDKFIPKRSKLDRHGVRNFDAKEEHQIAGYEIQL